jgi:hypothetical protein
MTAHISEAVIFAGVLICRMLVCYVVARLESHHNTRAVGTEEFRILALNIAFLRSFVNLGKDMMTSP